MRFGKVAIAVALFSLVSAAAHATTYYVSTSGNDANAGTLAAPFATVTKATGFVKPGDTVYVRGGIYHQSAYMKGVGTSSARIVYSSYPGETAIFDGVGTTQGSDVLNLSSASYVDVVGFEVRNSTHIGITVWGGNNVRILNNHVHHNWRNGIYVGYDSRGPVTDIVIDGNEVDNNVLENQTNSMANTGGWACGIGVSMADRGQETNNNVHHNHGEGLGTGSTTNFVLTGNVSHDNFSENIYIESSRYIKVDRNLVYNTGTDATFFRFGYPSPNIGLANEYAPVPFPLSDVTVTNNIVIGGRWGFYYGNFELGGGLKNVTVANNTFYNSVQALVNIDNDAHQNTIIENNIFSGPIGSTVAGGGLTFRNNDWYGGTPGVAAGVGDVIANPRFTNPGGFTAADYRLTIGSGAIAAGVAVASVTSDYFGAARTAVFDIGAHQLSTGSAATPGDLTAPTVPAALTATAINSTSVQLSWNAATDNVGVSGYRIYRNGSVVTTTQGTTWTDQNLAAGTAYSYAVAAYDAFGNSSALTTTISVSTLPSGVLPGGSTAKDTTAPTAPAALATTSITSSSVSMMWLASTDNVGVARYTIYRDGVPVGNVTTPGYTDSNLKAGQKYTYKIVAFDATGNASSASNSVTATTATVKTRSHASGH